MEYESESFIYTISSQERKNNVDDNVTSYDFDFGGFNSQYNNFRVHFLSMQFNSTIATDALFYAHISGLNNDGYFSQGILKPDAMILPVGFINNTYAYTGEMFCEVQSARMKKNITITMLDSSMNEMEDEVGYNLEGVETNFLLVMKVIPIS